jgi:hypothetical protein
MASRLTFTDHSFLVMVHSYDYYQSCKVKRKVNLSKIDVKEQLKVTNQKLKNKYVSSLRI